MIVRFRYNRPLRPRTTTTTLPGMPYSVSRDPQRAWISVDFHGRTDGTDLIAARAEAAALNLDSAIRDFILDFSAVTALILDSETVSGIEMIDRERARTIAAGRGALVAKRDIVEQGVTYLAVVSPMALDYRLFSQRADAEAWLQGTLGWEPPAMPRARSSRP